MFLSSILKQYKRSGGITVGIVIGTFMISMLVGLAEKADVLKYVTPFQYFSSTLMLEGKFELVNSSAIENKHLLLIDDVVTTGATLEACGIELLKMKNVVLLQIQLFQRFVQLYHYHNQSPAAF